MQSLYPFIELQLINAKFSVEDMYAALNQVQQNKLASLVVPPFWVKKLRRDWGADNQATLGTVIGYPYGYQRTEVKQLETELALKDGANDIEVMINTSAWFSTQNNWPKIEFAKLGKLIHEHEVFFTVAIDAYYFDIFNLQLAIRDAVDAGADYIKIYQAFNLPQTLQIKRLIPDSVGLKVFVGNTIIKEMQQTIDAGIDRIFMTEFLLR